MQSVATTNCQFDVCSEILIIMTIDYKCNLSFHFYIFHFQPSDFFPQIPLIV